MLSTGAAIAPDLVIDAIILPPIVTAPCPTQVGVVVRNAGTRSARFPFAVCLQVAAGAEEAFRAEYVKKVARGGEGLRALGPNQSVQVDFEVVFPCRAQSWVAAEADCRHSVVGNLRSAPHRSQVVPSVVPVPWLFTEMRVGVQGSSGAITWDTNQLCADLPLAVEVSIENRGCAEAPVSTTGLTVTGTAGPIASPSWFTGKMPPGQTATSVQLVQLPSPPPPQVTIQACADTGGAVKDQCSTAGLCRSAVLPVSAGSGSPSLSLTVEGAVVPGEPPRVSWSVLNDCSDLGVITAAVFLGPDELYQSAATPIAPLGKAGEENVALTVPPSVAASLWTFGHHPLELRVTSPGAPGTTFNTTSQLQVEPEVPRSTWTWTPLGIAVWRQPYGVSATLTNDSQLAAMTPDAVTITEATATPGIATAGSLPASPSGSPAAQVPPTGSIPLSLFPLFQSWTWIDPWTFFPWRDLTTVSFTYVATFTLTDEFGNVYPPSTSPALSVAVLVPQAKQDLGLTAFHLLTSAIAAFAIAAVALSVGQPVAAGILFAIAWGLWGPAIVHKAMADDPPTPDFAYDERIRVSPISHPVRRDDAPPWADSLATGIDLLARVQAAHEALALIHPKILGARIDGDTKALRTQADDYRAALARLQAATAELPNALAQAREDLEADERLAGESQDAVEAWRSGSTIDAGRRLWRENDLPENVFDDLVERSAHFDELPPLGQALAGISGPMTRVAASLAEEGVEVLALAETP